MKEVTKFLSLASGGAPENSSDNYKDSTIFKDAADTAAGGFCNTADVLAKTSLNPVVRGVATVVINLA